MNFMKKIWGSILAIIMMCSFAFYTEAADIRDYPTVAVMNFGNKAITSRGLRDHDFASATEYAIYQLSACGWFDLVDYEQLGAIAQMHKINMSGLVDPGTAVQVGKFAGAQYMIVGYVTGLTTKENTFGYQHGNAGGLSNDQHVVTANVSMRIVDIETGRIVVAGLGKGSSTSTNTEIRFTKYRSKKNRTVNTTYSTNKNTSSSTSTSSDSSEEVDGYDEGYDEGYDDGYHDEENYDYDGDDFDYDTSNTTSTSSNDSSESYTRDVTETDEIESEDYKIVIGTVEVSDIQVRNAISKAVRDAVYGNMGIMTTLNNGKKLKIKTGF